MYKFIVYIFIYTYIYFLTQSTTDDNPIHDDDDVYLDKLQTRGVKKCISFTYET
jgi:hypothetical protein